MPDEYLLGAAQKSRLLHDLQAPLSNARGFRQELSEAIADLSTAIDSIGPELSDQSCKQLTDIINDDIIVCSDMLATSIEKLQQRLQEFDKMLSTPG